MGGTAETDLDCERSVPLLQSTPMARNMYPGRADPRPRPAANWRAFWLLVGALVAAIGLWLYLDPTPGADGSPASTIVIREGDGWTEATARLASAGIVRRPLVFKGIVLLSGARSSLLPGRYSLRRGMSARDLIAALSDPTNQANVVVPEGWRLEQIGERLVAQGLATSGEWRQAVAHPPKLGLLNAIPPGRGLEGYLYPDTYRFTEANAAQQMVQEATKNLDERLTPAIRDGMRAEGLTVHEGLTLASIVEREAQVPSERPLIASVFLNRLRTGMPLQADPTVQYAVGKSGNWWKQRLTASDLRTPSPYNTYEHKGLPPGPIACPGIAAIRAVASPARTRYLYFVARGDGTHAFAVTLEEHNENVRRYLTP
ncbi:MAG: endolytic transglycosylase MltG [Chloroflexota bacterium]|nr:endolytic transglycosylase MltG [Chloroflexota bacterium]